jgi:hypothetical protein
MIREVVTYEDECVKRGEVYEGDTLLHTYEQHKPEPVTDAL